MVYKCKCLDEIGNIIKEKISASDENELKQLIKNKGYKIIDFSKQNSLKEKLLFKNNKKLNDKELVYFCNQMHFILKSNTTLLNGLHIIKSERNKKQRINQIFSIIYQEVETGKSLSEIMNELSIYFPKLLINMTIVGENSGNLTEIFQRMQIYYKHQLEIKEKIKNAIIQPLFLLFTSFALIIFFLNFGLPELMSNIEIEKEQLPKITQIMLSLSDFLKNSYGYLMVGGVLTGYFSFYLNKRNNVKLFLHKLLTKIPFVGDRIKEIETYRLSITLYLYLKSGINLLNSLQTLSNIHSNLIARNSILEARETLLGGNSFYQGLDKSHFFDETFLKSIKIGEETGSLDDVLEEMSEYYNDKIDSEIKKGLTMLQPVLTIFIGIFVGIIALSIALPMFSMMDYVK